jgi:phage FluMu protein Com
MPIHFRCFFCDRVLSIASRKAGQVIVCPKCQGQVWVPDPDKPEEMTPGDPTGEDPVEIDVELVPVRPPQQPTAAVGFSRFQVLLVMVILAALLVMLFEVGLWLGRFLRPG